MVLLVRHGRTVANAEGVLAGWSPGVQLDDRGRQQAEALATRLSPLRLAAIVSSPLERCRQTAAAIAATRNGCALAVDDRLGECHYGDWTGQTLKSLTKDPLWTVVQAHPAAAVFPGADGESLRAMQTRAVDAIRDWNAKLSAENGSEATYLVCSHGDVIKAVVADALGLHLDLFQRITVDPCSLTVIRYTELRPFLLRLNDTGDIADLGHVPGGRAKRRSRRPMSGEAVVGGGPGAP
jgi:probable phosphomutase (TIGR03848 family)